MDTLGTPSNSTSPPNSTKAEDANLFADSCFRSSPRLHPLSQVLEESITSSLGADAVAGSKRTRSPSPQRSRSPPRNGSNIVPETPTNLVPDSLKPVHAAAAASGGSDEENDATGPDDAIPVDWLPGVFIRFLPPPRLPSPPRIISPPPNSEWRSPSPPRRVNWWSFFHHRN
jgi:hypothetical protein